MKTLNIQEALKLNNWTTHTEEETAEAVKKIERAKAKAKILGIDVIESITNKFETVCEGFRQATIIVDSIPFRVTEYSQDSYEAFKEIEDGYLILIKDDNERYEVVKYKEEGTLCLSQIITLLLRNSYTKDLNLLKSFPCESLKQFPGYAYFGSYCVERGSFWTITIGEHGNLDLGAMLYELQHLTDVDLEIRHTKAVQNAMKCDEPEYEYYADIYNFAGLDIMDLYDDITEDIKYAAEELERYGAGETLRLMESMENIKKIINRMEPLQNTEDYYVKHNID